MRAHPLSLVAQFVLLTFGVSWALWLTASAAAPAYAALLFLPGTIAPALVALWLAAREGGSRAAGALLARVFRWRVSIAFYLLAAGYMASVKLAAAALDRLATGTWPIFGGPVLLMLAGMLISTPVQAGEEIGWRGYMLPRLGAVIGFGPASLLIGLVWALWHLPMFYIAGGDMVGQSFVMFALAVTPLTAALAWLYVRTGGNLLLPMLMHAAVNNTTSIVPSALPPDPGRTFSFDASLVGAFTVGLLWIGAVIFLPAIWKVRSELSPEERADRDRPIGRIG